MQKININTCCYTWLLCNAHTWKITTKDLSFCPQGSNFLTVYNYNTVVSVFSLQKFRWSLYVTKLRIAISRIITRIKLFNWGWLAAGKNVHKRKHLRYTRVPCNAHTGNHNWNLLLCPRGWVVKNLITTLLLLLFLRSSHWGIRGRCEFRFRGELVRDHNPVVGEKTSRSVSVQFFA